MQLFLLLDFLSFELQDLQNGDIQRVEYKYVSIFEIIILSITLSKQLLKQIYKKLSVADVNI